MMWREQAIQVESSKSCLGRRDHIGRSCLSTTFLRAGEMSPTTTGDCVVHATALGRWKIRFGRRKGCIA